MTAADWRGARVLVTGARGFIGSALCARLICAGAVVHGVSSQSDPPPVEGLAWWRIDFADFSAVSSLMSSVRPDFVFHLAGHVTGSQDVRQVLPTFHSNLESTVALLTAATEATATRIILAGSMREPDPADPSDVSCSPYAASKWAATGYARMFHALYKLPVVVARLMMVYGPGQWDVSKIVPYAAVSLLNHTSPRVSSGFQELDWVFVDDVVDGLMAVAGAASVDGATVDLGSGSLRSVRAVVEQIHRLVGADTPIQWGAVKERPFERPRVAQIEQARRLTGWTPQTSLEEGLARTVSWIRERVADETIRIA